MKMVWHYTRRDGKQRGLTVQPSEIIDARMAGAKWHPDMRTQFGPQCSHGNMMQIRESVEWQSAVQAYAIAHHLDMNDLLIMMCKYPQQPRNPTPRMPRMPDDGSPKPGSLVIDDGGRREWRRRNKRVMRGKIGDCATRAIQVTLRDTEHAVSYGKIRSDVIADKQQYHADRHSEAWRNNNFAVYNDTTRRLLEHYTHCKWIYISVWGVIDKTPAFKTVAKLLASAPPVVLVSRDHVVALKNGAIYDTWDSTLCRVKMVLCRKKDASAVKLLLRQAI